MEKTILTNNFEETQKVGEEFASLLSGGDILCLRGDLGAGKTTFMQGLAKGLGIKQRIISPTFIIVRTYEVTGKGKVSAVKNLYHIDLYRTESLADMESVGLSEILAQKNAIIAVEWAEKLSSLLPEKRWELDFQWLSENERKIEIKHYE